MKFHGLEQTIRLDFLRRWSGWRETYQPGLGSGIGIPDTQIMAHPPAITPIELKRGTIINGRLFSDKIRPEQVSWHTRFALAGGNSYFYVGVCDPSGDIVSRHIVNAMLAIASREQGTIGARLLSMDTFSEDIKAFLSK